MRVFQARSLSHDGSKIAQIGIVTMLVALGLGGLGIILDRGRQQS